MGYVITLKRTKSKIKRDFLEVFIWGVGVGPRGGEIFYFFNFI